MEIGEESLKLHEELKGKLEVKSKIKIKTKKDLSLVYTPGVAESCKKIVDDKDNSYKYTMKGNTVAVITDGSAVLGLGNIGSLASLPVMEGKAMLLKEFAGIDAFPILIREQNVEKTIETIRNISTGFGAINLEDFKAPECFRIEDALQDLGIPVMHDDQHGTAVVVLAGLINSLKVKNLEKEKARIVVNGAGAAGVAITRILLKYGFKYLILVDSKGIIHRGREHLNHIKEELAEVTNHHECVRGSLSDAVKGADIFIGVSKPNVLKKEMIQTMHENPIIFALANPVPEIMPDDAKEGGAFIVATGRSDFPNQINNVLAFPGIFKGALEIRAEKITDKMKIAAAEALASIIKKPTPEEIIPNPFDRKVVKKVAEAVKGAWEK